MLSNRRTQELLHHEVDFDESIISAEDERAVADNARQIIEIIRTATTTRMSLRKLCDECLLALPDIKTKFPVDDLDLSRADASAEVSGYFVTYVLDSFLQTIRTKYPGIYRKYESEKAKDRLREWVFNLVYKMEQEHQQK